MNACVWLPLFVRDCIAHFMDTRVYGYSHSVRYPGDHFNTNLDPMFNIDPGQEYAAVVEFAPFQKISKKKLKKKDAKAGSIEEGTARPCLKILN